MICYFRPTKGQEKVKAELLLMCEGSSKYTWFTLSVLYELECNLT